MRRVGVLALEQLAFGERGARLREGEKLLGVLVARELRERAGEQQIAGRDRDVAPRDRRDRGMPAAQLRAVDQVIVHERRRMDELDRDRGAHEAFLAVGRVRRRPPGRLGGEHHQQRAQSLAARDHGRVRVPRERRAGLRGHALEVALGVGHARAQLGTAALHDRVEPLDADEHVAACGVRTVPLMRPHRGPCRHESRRSRRR